MKKIALVYTSIGHPELPYMTALRNGLLKYQNDGLEFSVFSCSPLDKDCLQEVQLLYATTTLRFLKRLMLFSLSYPLKFLQYFTQKLGKLGLKDTLVSWSRFAPILVAEPDIIQLTQSGLIDNFKDIFPLDKFIVSFLGADITLRPLYDLKWENLLRTDIFTKTGCSHFVSNFLLEESFNWGGNLEKSRVIYIGIDTDTFHPLPHGTQTDRNELSITTIGRFEWQKGHVYALHALKILKDLGYRIQYNVIGDGSLYSEVFYWKRHLGIDGQVNITGYLSHEEIISLLRSTDIYVQPSVTESLCVAVMEAMSMALPVVASRVGGIPETVLNGKTGFLVPPAKPQALADSLATLIEDQKLRQRMGQAGRIRIIENFSLKHEVAGWLDLYSRFG